MPRSSVRTNALVIAGSQVATWMITSVTFALVPRYLGAADMGQYALAGTFATMAATVASLGIGPLITREVARSRNAADSVLYASAMLGLLLGLLAAIIAPIAAFAAGYSGRTLFIIALQCAFVPAIVLTQFTTAAIHGFEKMNWTAAADVILKLTLLLAAIVVVIRGWGLLGIVAASILASSVSLLVQCIGLWRITNFRLLSKRTSLPLLRLMRESRPFLFINLTWMLYGAVDVFLLSFLGDEASIGVYSTVMRLLGTLLFVPTTIMMVTFPRLSASSHEASQGRLAGQALRLTVSSGVALSIGAIAISDPLFVSILGDSFMQHTGPVVVAFALSVVPTSVSTVASRMAFAADRQKAVAWIGTGAVVAKILLGLVLIPLFGEQFDNPALGAAVALVLTESGMSIAMLRFLPAGALGSNPALFYGRLCVAGFLAALAVAGIYGASPLGAGLGGGGVFGVLLVVLRVYTTTEIRVAAIWLRGRGRISPQRVVAR